MLAVTAALLLLVLPGTESVHATPNQTIVSLTFDDGTQTQYAARSILASHGMKGTFYINSAKVGTDDSYYMTWSQIHNLAADGNEIGGHTAFHVNLPQTDSNEAQREICNDRVDLLNQGFQATDFAYPYGAFNSSIESMVQACGYNSARTTNQMAQGVSESIPPQDPYAIRIAGSANAGTSLSQLEGYVSSIQQAGGGWAPIVFHLICNACDPNSITQSNFTAFLDWLQQQVGTGNVSVQTVQQVIGGAVQPGVNGPAPPPPPNGANGLRNASLEQDTNGDLAPDCWDFDTFGNNTFTWTRTSDAHSGTKAERVDISNFVSGDDKLVVHEDLGYCSPSVTPGRTYRMTAWYKSSAPVYFTAFTRNSIGAFSFWVSSPTFPASSSYTQATWVTPAVPSGATGISFGLALPSNGFLTVDDLGFDDANASGGGDTTAPTVTLTSPASGATVAGTVPLSANASDNVAVDHVDFLVDSTVVGTVTTAPYMFNWNSRTMANGSHTIRARAVDTSGNSTTTTAITVTVLNSNANLLQNPSLETATGSTPTCWLLGGYGTNTFAWTRTSDAHTGSFGEKLDITALTNGDRKLVNAQDTGACAPAGTPGHSYTVTAWYKSATSHPVMFAYYRNSSGAWTYWSQSAALASASSWTMATWSTPALPAGATNLSVGMGLMAVGSVTMDDFTLFDNAPAPDTTPPSSAISCNGAAEPYGCASGWYDGPVSVTLTAADNQDGSGVQQIRYTTDGSDPTATTGTVYTGAFAVGSTTTVKYRAFDNAGNAEAVHSQLIQIDTTPPVSTISCNGGVCSSAFYNAAVSVSLAATDAQSGPAEIRYTTDGSDPTSSNGNVYLGPFSVASTATVKYRAFDNVGNAEAVHSQAIQIDTTAPTSTISCNGAACSNSFYNAPVSVSLAATDQGGSGVAQIRYTTDGSDPTATTGTVYNGPFTVSSTTRVRYRAFDNAGNAEAVNAPLIRIDTAAPTSTIGCNGGTCGSGFYSAGVSISLVASDVDSGVASIRYTTDGSDPTSNSGTLYVGPFTLASTATVKYRAFDNAGNAEAVNSQLIQVDTTPPTSTISCDNAPCAGTYGDPVSVSLAATDDAGGSGVAAIRYTTDGSDPTAGNGTVYSAPFTIETTTTVKYRAFDNAGNAEAVRTQVIHADATPPSVAVTSPAPLAIVSGTVTLAADASDNVAVDHVDFLVDGSVAGTDSTAPYSFDWNSQSVLDGAHTITATAVDTSANSTTSDGVLVTVANGPGDATPPTSSIACNSNACSSSYYNAAVSVSITATDNQGGSGVAEVRYTTDGSDPTPSNGTVYSGPFSLSTTATVKYRAFDNAGNAEAVNSQLIRVDTVAPSATLTAPADGASVSGTVTLTANASDDVAVEHVDFLVDGSVVGTDTTAPYSFDWSSQSVVNGSHTIKARAVDTAGNSTDSTGASVTVANGPGPDTIPPTTTITCNNAACSSGYYNASVSVRLTATDNQGGSGVAQIRYTTNGSDPTANSGTVYTGAFAVTTTTTVKYRAFDNAGNAEAVNTQSILIDTVAPTSTITCNSSACSSNYYTAPVSVALGAADAGGSGVSQIRYTTDGSDPTTTNGTVYSGPFSLTTTTTVKYRAFDNAGNAEAINAPLIRVDIVAPTTTINCNGNPCASAYTTTVSVSLAATDNQNGSGVSQIRYTTNGTDPTATTGTVYSTPFNLSSTTTVKYRAFDVAGNAEAVNTRTIQIDATAPTASITAPANGAIVSGTLTLSANASDNVAVDHVDFLVDGSVVGTDSTAPYSISWNSQTVADGQRVVKARAVDTAGNTTTSGGVTLNVTNTNLLQNASLETASGSTPTCWLLGGYGNNTFTWTRTSDAHTGSFAEKLDINTFTDGDRKLVNAQDAGACAPAATPGKTYTVTVWYKSTVAPRIFTYYRNSGGAWTFWANSGPLPVSAGWSQVSYTTPAAPAGATNLSIGLGISAVGSLTMDDFGLFGNS